MHRLLTVWKSVTAQLVCTYRLLGLESVPVLGTYMRITTNFFQFSQLETSLPDSDPSPYDVPTK